eukprot:m.244247 g.244247  ORF g.244247 m.244247 type:complete len:328 (+) comp40244_c0_seq76:631-1614(+)
MALNSAHYEAAPKENANKTLNENGTNTQDARSERKHGLKPSTLLFQQVSRVLKLARVQEVALGLGLLNFPELRIEASQFLRGKLPDLIISHSELYGQDSGLHDVNIEIIHTLVTHLLQSHPEEIGITREQLDIFLAALRKDFPKERVPVILSPLLYPGWKDIDIGKLLGESVSTPVHLSSVGVWKLMEEMGYYATSKPEVLQDVFASAHLDEITPLLHSKFLGNKSINYKAFAGGFSCACADCCVVACVLYARVLLYMCLCLHVCRIDRVFFQAWLLCVHCVVLRMVALFPVLEYFAFSGISTANTENGSVLVVEEFSSSAGVHKLY